MKPVKLATLILFVASALHAQNRLVRANGVNSQTGTTYPYVAGDFGKLVTHCSGTAIAATLPTPSSSLTAFHAGWFVDVHNRCAGTLTITPTASTIDTAANLALTTGQGARIFSNGTSYFTQRGGSGAGNLAIEVDGVAIGSDATVNLINGLGSGMVGVDAGTKINVTQTIDSAVYLSKATHQAGTPLNCRPSGGTDAYVCALGPVLTAYTRGTSLVLDADVSNTGTATVNAGPGVKSILNPGGALADNDILANKPIWIIYDGTQFIRQGGGSSLPQALDTGASPAFTALDVAGLITAGAANAIQIGSAAGFPYINSGTGDPIIISGGTQLSTRAEPTCNSGSRGTLIYVAGGAGVADTYRICRKDAADAYAYAALF